MAADKFQRETKTCIDNEELQALLSETMPAADVAAVLQHAANCESCRMRLREAGFHDPAIAPDSTRSADSTLGHKAAGRASDTSTSDVTSNDAQSDTTKSGSRTYFFLTPPQAPGELGRLGHYRILRVLGEGGIGTVFEAEDTQLNRRVAVKVLRLGIDDVTRQRFLREAQLAASLNSDRIVTIHHIGDDRGCPFLVMELLQGEVLDQRMKRKGQLSLAEALRIAREAAEGLAIAHDRGLVHRDIKPANLWLEHRPSDAFDFRVKLLDFGIARPIASDAHLTEEGMIVGTPSYMCPEQAHGEPLDARSDLFSLGCVIYAMLAGESPFARSTTIRSIRAVAEEKATPIRNKLPKLPAPVGALIDRLIAKNPKDRPSDARSVVEEIRCLELLAQPTAALPMGLPATLVREALNSKMKPGWAGWSGIAAVIAAAVIGVWFKYRHFSENPRAAKPPDLVAAATLDSRAPASAAVPAPSAGLPPIKVGILHSYSGPMATSERSVSDALLFAIDEINSVGGVLGGRQIEPVIRDGKSDPKAFAQLAEELITNEHVATLFGVWRSTCRKAVEEVCRKHDHLLVFPKADEGLEQSPYVIYMGGAPNQQTIPAVKWAYAFLGKRKFLLVGTEGLFSRASHEIIKDELKALGASVVGEEYCPVGDANFHPVLEMAKKSEADVMLNTVSGSGNIALFSALHESGLEPGVMPVISYDLTEEELRMLTAPADQLAGNYACWSYFQSLPDKSNEEFIHRFRKRFGPTRIVNDPMAAAYAGMHLWAKGVNAAKSDRVTEIRSAMVRQEFEAPEGLVKIDPETHRAVRMARIGQVGKELEFEVVWTSPKPIAPQVFPATRSREAWEEYLQSLRASWGGQWNPDVPVAP